MKLRFGSSLMLDWIMGGDKISAEAEMSLEWHRKEAIREAKAALWNFPLG